MNKINILDSKLIAYIGGLNLKDCCIINIQHPKDNIIQFQNNTLNLKIKPHVGLNFKHINKILDFLKKNRTTNNLLIISKDLYLANSIGLGLCEYLNISEINYKELNPYNYDKKIYDTINTIMSHEL